MTFLDPVWTPQRIALLTELWNEDRPVKEMATYLGTTGPAICSKARYIGLKQRLSDWPKEDRDFASEKWLAGWSAGKISQEMNGRYSRNSVIGKMHRLGHKRPLDTVFQLPHGNHRQYRKMRQRPPLTRLPPIPQTQWMDFKPRNIGILELTFDEGRPSACRWITTDETGPEAKYCGHPVHDRSFCEYHAQIAYMPRISRTDTISNNS